MATRWRSDVGRRRRLGGRTRGEDPGEEPLPGTAAAIPAIPRGRGTSPRGDGCLRAGLPGHRVCGMKLLRPSPDGMMSAVRCFVAVPVAEPVRRMIVRVQEALRRADADVRWVVEGTLHLTLKFCGDLDEDQVARLGELLAVEAGRWRPMALEYAGVGTFPDRGAPRVVWAGATGDVERLTGLA